MVIERFSLMAATEALESIYRETLATPPRPLQRVDGMACAIKDVGKFSSDWLSTGRLLGRERPERSTEAARVRSRSTRLMGEDRALSGKIQNALVWSALSNLLFRFSPLAVGIVLARLLAPREFGVYAVALTVQVILMTVADLGLSADLIRTPEPERRAPTVASLGLCSGISLAVISAATSAPLAGLLGSPESAPVIVVLSLTLALAGVGVVPFAMMQRRFMQKEFFFIAVVDFCVSTPLTLLLVFADYGAMSLAIGRVAAQSISVALQFYLSGTRPRFGFDRGVSRSVLQFGLPVAGANLLSWAALSLDNAVIANMAGATDWVLCPGSDISSWPMTS